DDWFKHNHHTDPNYKGVILHVVFDKESIKRNSPNLPTLCLKPCLNKPLRAFFEQFDTEQKLPCAQKMSYISPAAFEAQVAKAHLLYFEQKVDDLFRFYNPDLPPSDAWKQLLVIALFDGLGIAHNREPMRKLAKRLLQHIQNIDDLPELKALALKEARQKGYRWKKKGSRPANHPQVRITQGCEIGWCIMRRPFKSWLNAGIQSNFNDVIKSMKTSPGIGKKRAGILYGIVWLPAAYI